MEENCFRVQKRCQIGSTSRFIASPHFGIIAVEGVLALVHVFGAHA